MQPAFATVGLIGKYKSPEIATPLLKLAAFLEGRGVKVLIDRLTASHVSDHRYPVLALEEIGRDADLAIVLGGDGTMLNIARTLAPFDVALIGINQGRLGFLTDISLDTMVETLGSILDGKSVTEERMLIATEVFDGAKRVYDVLAFNEAVVSKGIKGSMIELEVRIDGKFLYALRADGLIVATPTGSTAYALSSGGPIIHPGLSAMALVPICPHTLSDRPILVSATSIIEVRLIDRPDSTAEVACDGRVLGKLNPGDTLTVRAAGSRITLLHPAGYDYFRLLRSKLNWGRRSFDPQS